MRHDKLMRKVILGVSAVLGGGLVLQGNCTNTLLSITPCGTVFAFCTPADQASLIFPYLELPDYDADPSCTIPLGCGDRGGSDILPTNPDFPGGGPSDPPEENSGGGAGGGFGGGGGGI